MCGTRATGVRSWTSRCSRGPCLPYCGATVRGDTPGALRSSSKRVQPTYRLSPVKAALACCLATALIAFAGRAPVKAVEEPRPVGDAPVTVSASRVEYYSDVAAVIARGGVSVDLPDGAHATGDA